MFRRAKKGKSMLKPDRHHLHNIFMRAGFSSRRSLVAILLLGCGYALIGIIGELYNIPEYMMFWGFLASLIVYTLVLQNIWTILRFVRSHQRR
jgi:UDP-GlcNAc:undecaprenyl-phosphate GlcNAc-1-phosphate transferase